MEIESLRHEVTANNLANANTPGFRRTLLAISAREPNGSPNNRGGKPASTHVDFTQGPLNRTGRTLDVALNGDGFFVVETENGPRYTRNGSFHLDSTNQLVTSLGDPVLGGGPIAIPGEVALSSITIGPDGTIRGDGTEIGKLDVVNFQDVASLKQVGANLFDAGQAVPEEPANTVVVQGSLESSNTSVVHEMIRMIIGMRHFEAAQQSLKSISDVLQQYTTFDG